MRSSEAREKSSKWRQYKNKGKTTALTVRPRLGGDLHQGEGNGEEAEEQVGDGQVDDEEVARGAHLRLAGHRQTDQPIADGADEDEHGVDDAQTGEAEAVQRPVLVVLLHQLVVVVQNAWQEGG